jgi:basic amino acid/polyamine antiporter, APA family
MQKKALGLWTLIALVIGNMVGSGVFLLPSSLAQFGSISLLAWILTSIGAICIALVFARLAGIFPKIGGPYAYCRDSFGDFTGFQVAYNYWLYIWIGNAAIAVSFVGYLSFFFPVLNHYHVLGFIAAVSCVWILTWVNVRGVKEAGILQLATVVLKLIPLVLVATLGLSFMQPHNFAQFNVTHHSAIFAIMGAATLTLWALTGVESATVPADDVENPKKNIPRATMIGTVVAALLYVFGTIAVMGVLPMHQLAHSSSPFADAALHMFGRAGADIVALAAIISTLGAVNGWIMLQGQVTYAAAKDDLFPKFFAKRTNNNTPVNGLVFSSMLITALLALNYHASLVNEFTFIILLATMAILVVYLLTCMAELMLMIKHPEKFNVKTLSKDIVVCIIATIYIVFAIAGGGKEIVFYGALLFFSSFPVYVWVKWRGAKYQ